VCAARCGSALAEAVVAALVLVVGVLATAGAVAGSARDARRARVVEAGAAVLAERVSRWRAAPCAAGAGERVGPGWRERWQVSTARGLGVLADTVEAAGGVGEPRVGVVAVAGCGP
jgi:Tfp pilus assembly protein PilV